MLPVQKDHPLYIGEHSIVISLPFIFLSGLICAAMTTIGPMLTQAMHAAAIDASQSIAMEVLIALSISPLSMLLYSLNLE
ncbi:MAG: hypothetical protein JSS50_00510 [Proteobacteria bacterium]|nr:hypothetical protein [Pseudomonadota bacterium]